MLTPTLPSRDARGKRWLQAKVHQLLADRAVALAPPSSASDPACYGGRGPETSTTLSLRLAGAPEPQVLHFRRTMIADCGAGLYSSQHNAIVLIRRRKRNKKDAVHPCQIVHFLPATTRGTVLPEVQPMRTPRHACHSTRRSRAPAKPCLSAPFLLRFRPCIRAHPYGARSRGEGAPTDSPHTVCIGETLCLRNGRYCASGWAS